MTYGVVKNGILVELSDSENREEAKKEAKENGYTEDYGIASF